MTIKMTSFTLAVCLGLSTAAMIGSVSGCAGTQYKRSTGEYIDDKSLAMRVHDALGDNPEYKFDGVNVEVFRGTVQLNGFVATQDQKRQAEKIARTVQGIRQVVNNLSITPAPAPGTLVNTNS